MMEMMKEMSRSITEGFQNQAKEHKEHQINEQRTISLRPQSPLIEKEKRKLENGKDEEQNKNNIIKNDKTNVKENNCKNE